MREAAEAASFHFKPSMSLWVNSTHRLNAISKESIVNEPNCERTSRQGAAKPVRELQRRAPLECSSCCIPIDLAYTRGRVCGYVGSSLVPK